MSGYRLGIVLWFTFLAIRPACGQVRATVQPITIPTWEVGPRQVHSDFSDANGRIYPYTLNDALTENKVDRTYAGVFLENQYVQLLILPEIGGRLHGARDKTNDYVWIYWQRTIKPGLVGMTGAWISGGIEWNFPQGHRPSGFMPVASRIVRHDDGSATVWVGETELLDRMRWLVGMTVFPGRSYVRCDYVLVNPTDQRHAFAWWSTAATHANQWAQAQYPGDVVAGHGKHQFWHWPIHDGVDLTWWKNSPNASSYFAIDNPSDWFGTYDHRARAGMIHVADHHVMPGKKLWTWGSGPSGRIWEDILTEGGGPYFEPQAGAFCDNQPDFHWMEPGEVKTAHDYWYPVRDTRGVHQATKDFAVNTELTDGTARAAVYATGVFPDCKIVLENAATGAVLSEAVATVSPDKPWSISREVPDGVTVYDLHLSVYDAAGKLRIELRRQPPKQVALPQARPEPGNPETLNQDELYHAGEWLDRFHRTDEALACYRQALKNDPRDSRVNVEMGFLALKQGKWHDALGYFDKAAQRDGDNARISYGKGLAHTGLGDFQQAYDEFYRATHAPAFRAVGYYHLAKLDLRRGNFRQAVQKLDEAAAQNGKFADLPALKAAALRRLGDHQQALAAARRARELDPLHPMGGYEKMLALRNTGAPWESWSGTWRATMHDAVEEYLELAVAYGNAGLLADAIDVLAICAGDRDAGQTRPMVNYFRGYYHESAGDAVAAAADYAAARRGPVDYTNPHRLEAEAALEAAIRHQPDDARAQLFLGNLLYARGRREEGFAHWRQAAHADPHLLHAWRNVAYAQQHLEGDLRASLATYRQCLDLDPRDARVLLEYDRVAEALKVSEAERLALLQQREEVVNTRDDLLGRLVDLRLVAGDEKGLRRAYDTVRRRHFHSWEGKYDVHHCWVEVNQRLGDAAFAKGDYPAALRHYEEACEYPKNLEVAPRTPDFRAHLYWNLARVHQAMNQPQIAADYLEKAAAERYTQPHLGTYYQALAENALGNSGKYRSALDTLERHARGLISGKSRRGARAEAVGHYLLSLVLREKGKTGEADAGLQQALAHNPRVRRVATREAQLDVARAHQ